MAHHLESSSPLGCWIHGVKRGFHPPLPLWLKPPLFCLWTVIASSLELRPSVVPFACAPADSQVYFSVVHIRPSSHNGVDYHSGGHPVDLGYLGIVAVGLIELLWPRPGVHSTTQTDCTRN